MKKKYIAPSTQCFELFWENGVALNILSGQDDAVISDENDILSTKKENPVWGGKTQSGIWDNMDK